MADAAEPGKLARARRLTRITALLSFGAVAAALVAAIGSGQGLWHFRAGFEVLRYAVYAALIGGCIGFAALWLAARANAKRLVWVNVAAILVGGAYTFHIGNLYAKALATPSIHDASTNLEDMPQFRKLTLRADNLAVVPDDGHEALKSHSPEARWKALHRMAYPELKTARVPWSVEETVRRVEALARERGWHVANSDPAEGILEATDTSFWFRLSDDVVVRARRASGERTEVDMRSVSREIISDSGVNAERIRAFMRDLGTSTTSEPSHSPTVGAQ